MGHQVSSSDERRVWAGIDDPRELRNPSLNGLVERKLSAVPQLQQRQRREDLGDRADTKHGVGADGCPPLERGLPVHAGHQELAVDHESPGEPGRFECPELLLELGAKLLGRGPDLLDALGVREMGQLRALGGLAHTFGRRRLDSARRSLRERARRL
jgi:hypothetical protein